MDNMAGKTMPWIQPEKSVLLTITGFIDFDFSADWKVFTLFLGL